MNPTRRPANRWRTWSGTARCAPARLLRPTNEAAIVDAVTTATARDEIVRASGTGHSFNALACTDDVLIDLSAYTGVGDLDRDNATVTVRAGTTIREINTALAAAGLALANIGTLADQTVAGAISTGNHGSGLTHGPFSSQVVRLRLVTADGSIIDCDPTTDPDVMRCARTALGTLGIVSTVTLRCVPSFNLRTVHGEEPFDGFLNRIDEWAGSADHVTFNLLPWTDRVSTHALSRTDDPPRPGRIHHYRRTLDELRCGSIGLLARAHVGSVPILTDRVSGRGHRPADVAVSHQAFCFAQPVRFVALEHALPLTRLAPGIRALRDLLRRDGRCSPYSVLGRVGAGDDSPLSPSYGRPTGYLNLTVPRTARFVELCREVEGVLRDFDARPHWGKAHTATAEELAPRYPQWDAFQRVRAQLDPHGTFTNAYVRRVLGPVRTSATHRAGFRT